MVKIFFAILLGTALSGIWFGIRMMLEVISSKTGIKLISRFSTVLAAIVPLGFILQYSRLQLFKMENVVEWKSWLIVGATALITAAVVSINESDNIPAGRKRLWYALDGVMMEVPQRMMMQTFVCLLLDMWETDIVFSALVTAIVWCISICIQCVIMKRRFDKTVVVELLSSFIFSVGVGVVLIRTELIVFTMVAHFMERIVSTEIRRRKYAVG